LNGLALFSIVMFVSVAMLAPAEATGQAGGREQAIPPKQLWSEFPLNPTGAKLKTRPAPRAEARTPRASRARPQSFAQAHISGTALTATLLLLVSLGIVALLAWRAGARPSLLVRLLSRQGARKTTLDRAPARSRVDGEDAHSTPVPNRLRPHLLAERSDARKGHPHESGGGEVDAEDELASATNEQVRAILSAARAAAREIRRVAQEEAARERVRVTLAAKAVEAARAAGTTRAAQRLLEEERRGLVELRLEAEKRSAEVRRSADAYAEERRREAELEAGRIVAEAARRAELLEAVAGRGRDGPHEEAGAIEDWRQPTDTRPSLEEALRPDRGTRNSAA
jgi:hypothetical protein